MRVARSRGGFNVDTFRVDATGEEFEIKLDVEDQVFRLQLGADYHGQSFEAESLEVIRNQAEAYMAVHGKAKWRPVIVLEFKSDEDERYRDDLGFSFARYYMADVTGHKIWRKFVVAKSGKPEVGETDYVHVDKENVVLDYSDAAWSKLEERFTKKLAGLREEGRKIFKAKIRRRKSWDKEG